MDAEIPVVCINAPLPDTNTLCYIGGDHSESSRLAAHLLGEFIGRKGQIAIITSAIASENNNSSVKVREENFEKLIQDNYPEISIVEHVESFEDPEITYRKTLDLLRGCPKLKGIYITCGGAYKVGDALNEMNLSNKIAVISHAGQQLFAVFVKSSVVVMRVCVKNHLIILVSSRIIAYREFVYNAKEPRRAYPARRGSSCILIFYPMFPSRSINGVSVSAPSFDGADSPFGTS